MGYAYLFIFIILIHEMFLYEPYVNDDDVTDTTAPYVNDDGDTNTTTPMFDCFVQVNSFEQNSVLFF